MGKKKYRPFEEDQEQESRDYDDIPPEWLAAAEESQLYDDSDVWEM